MLLAARPSIWNFRNATESSAGGGGEASSSANLGTILCDPLENTPTGKGTAASALQSSSKSEIEATRGKDSEAITRALAASCSPYSLCQRRYRSRALLKKRSTPSLAASTPSRHSARLVTSRSRPAKAL